MDQKTSSAGATLATTVYGHLRADIVSGRLQPGDPLRLGALRARYAVGNSPLREALNRLVTDRLVVQEDQRGFRVAGASESDLRELVRTRCWIEEIALRESIANGDQAWEETLVIAFHRLNKVSRVAEDDFHATSARWDDLHREFHRALIAACGSRWLLDFCEQLHDQAARYRNVAHALVYPERDPMAEHREILDAVVARDADAAVNLLLTHYRTTSEIVLAKGGTLLVSPEPAERE